MLLGPQLEPIRLPIPSPKDTLLKNMATMELKTVLQHPHGKELVGEVQKVVTPASPFQVKTKMTEKEPEIPKMTSFDSSLRRVSTRKKKKEPTPDSSTKTKEEGSSEDVKMVSSSKEPELEEEEAELETPPPKKTKLKTWTFE